MLLSSPMFFLPRSQLSYLSQCPIYSSTTSFSFPHIETNSPALVKSMEVVRNNQTHLQNKQQSQVSRANLKASPILQSRGDGHPNLSQAVGILAKAMTHIYSGRLRGNASFAFRGCCSILREICTIAGVGRSGVAASRVCSMQHGHAEASVSLGRSTAFTYVGTHGVLGGEARGKK